MFDTKTKVADKIASVRRAKPRKAITFNREDKINNCLEDLLQIYEGMSEVEIVKLALIELRMRVRNTHPPVTSASFRVLNSPQVFTSKDKQEFDDVLVQTRARGNQWLLRNGYSQEGVDKLSEEQIYDIVAQA